MSIVFPECQITMLNPNSNLVPFQNRLESFFGIASRVCLQIPQAKHIICLQNCVFLFFSENKLAKCIAQLALLFIYILPIICKLVKTESLTVFISSADIYIFILGSFNMEENDFYFV